MQQTTIEKYYQKDCLPELLLSGNINDGFTGTLNAVHNSTSHNLNALQTGFTGNLNAVHQNTASVIASSAQGTRDAMEASNRNGIAVLKEVADASRDSIRETARVGFDNIRETSRVGSDLAKDVSDARSSVERTSAENRLQMAIASGEIRELIGTTSTVNLLAIKDNLAAIKEESCKNVMETIKQGCETREVVKDKFYELNTEMLKGFANTQLEALKNKCDLEAKIAECCCEQKALTISESNATRALILAEGQRRLESENADLRLKVLLNDNNGKGK